MHVIVATDGSKQSLAAARQLKSFADPAKMTEVSVVAVLRPLAAVAFADDESRGKLNAITHPLVGARTAELIGADALALIAFERHQSLGPQEAHRFCEVPEFAVIDEHDVAQFGPFVIAELGGHPRAGILLGEPPGDQPLHSDLRVRAHADHEVERGRGRGSGQKGNVVRHHRIRRRGVPQVGESGPHQRMRDALQASPRAVVREDHRGQGSAIQRAVSGDHPAAELRRHRRQAG